MQAAGCAEECNTVPLVTIFQVLKNETKEEYEKRLKFVLELLATRTNPTVDGRLFHTLFDILKEYAHIKRF